MALGHRDREPPAYPGDAGLEAPALGQEIARASPKASSLVRVIAPAQRDELAPVNERFCSRRESAFSLAESRPLRQRSARSLAASEPRWVPTALSTAASAPATFNRVRTRAPDGGATTNAAVISRRGRLTSPSSSSAATLILEGFGRRGWV
jgi:hypothetical protein